MVIPIPFITLFNYGLSCMELQVFIFILFLLPFQTIEW